MTILVSFSINRKILVKIILKNIELDGLIMSTFDQKRWFTEVHSDVESAYSLKITARLAQEQSPFQKVEVFQTTQFGKLMTIDGCTMVSTRENFLYHEMMTHPALFTHENPETVVIIGGGDCGTLREVLKHKGVKQAYQIDIDEVVTKMALQYFPELCESNEDPRASIMFDDGIKFMAQRAPESVDIVIVDSTDPVGPGEGLFNHVFYQSCLAALKPGGILVQQSESPLYHLPLLPAMRHAMEDVGFTDLQTLNFPQPIYPSGWRSCTLARKDQTIDGFREDDAQQATFETLYYNVEIHQGAKALPNFVKKAFNRS